MKVQKHIREHAQSAIAGRVVVLVAKNGGEYLRLGGIFNNLHLLFGLGRHFGGQGFHILLHPSHHLGQNSASTVLSVLAVVASALPVAFSVFALFSHSRL